MLKGTVKLSNTHWSMGVFPQVSPPMPGMSSTLSSDSFLQDTSDRRQKKNTNFCVLFTRKIFNCLSRAIRGTSQPGTLLSMISSSYDWYTFFQPLAIEMGITLAV